RERPGRRRQSFQLGQRVLQGRKPLPREPGLLAQGLALGVPRRSLEEGLFPQPRSELGRGLLAQLDPLGDALQPVERRGRRFSARSAPLAWSASGRSRALTSASRSRARSTWTCTRANFSSALCRRCLNLPSPAASSSRTRRSSGLLARISSTFPWLITDPCR